MSTVTLLRGEQPRLPLLDRKRDFLSRAFEQASKACRQFSDWVDIDRLRNHVRHLSSYIKPASEEAVALRAHIFRTYKRADIKQYAQEINLHLHFPRERLLRCLVWIMSALVFVSTVTNAFPPSTVRSVVIDLETLASQNTAIAKVIGPINWLTGGINLKGSPKAVAGAFNYATKAGYEFTKTEADVDRLIANGTLVRLDSRYITFGKDVSYPYALPVVAQVVDRIGVQYASYGCGKLVVTSGVRPLDLQEKLPNGSDDSVHPTGMSFDLRRPIDENGPCYKKLESILTDIEASRRIDVTAEKSPRHFHVVVVTHTYERWLAARPPQLDPELYALALTVHLEAAGDETMEGYRAIAWTIRNRVRSKDFPNTIVEVVSQGAAGRSNGGCQFSYRCDGKADSVETLCVKPDQAISQMWLNRCQERFATILNISKQVLAEPESADPTGGAVLYYAASMKQPPYWARPRTETRTREDGSEYQVFLKNGDLKTGTIKQIWSHWFGCRNNSDVCRKGDVS